MKTMYFAFSELFPFRYFIKKCQIYLYQSVTSIIHQFIIDRKTFFKIAPQSHFYLPFFTIYFYLTRLYITSQMYKEMSFRISTFLSKKRDSQARNVTTTSSFAYLNIDIMIGIKDAPSFRLCAAVIYIYV